MAAAVACLSASSSQSARAIKLVSLRHVRRPRTRPSRRRSSPITRRRSMHSGTSLKSRRGTRTTTRGGKGVQVDAEAPQQVVRRRHAARHHRLHHERVKRKHVVRVQLVEVVDDEEEHCAARRHGCIFLGERCDLGYRCPTRIAARRRVTAAPTRLAAPTRTRRGSSSSLIWSGRAP